ncbi:MAG TPA: tetratricopeptide repeat protein, partial [Kineosporiaceae bacterium]|nr:tetratricopeptide repeat protein [Kineosporiaceae bacterium]
RRRVDAAVQWARLELALGRTDAVIDTLSGLVPEYPLAEPLEGALMAALQAAGRRAEALDRYTAVRERLADTLGTDPGPELAAVHGALLRDEPATALFPAAGRARDVVPVPPPAQLPVGVSGFSGRDVEVHDLDELLPRPGARVPPVVVVTGMAGVGKTTLAVHWAHRVARHFPDGNLYVDLRGFDPGGEAVPAQHALHAFLEALGVPHDHLPDTLEAQVGLYRSLLAGRRLLVVLDNARDADHVRPLLPASPGCFALVTSRDQLAGLVTTAGARPLALDLPSADDARRLLIARLSRQRAADLAGLDEVAALCGRLPLALAIVATRAAVQPGLPLADLAAELREAQDGLAGFTDPDERSDVRAVFSWSYRRLSEDAARLFRLLGAQPGAGVTVAAAASVVGEPAETVRPLLAELGRAHLLLRVGPRYTFHDLVRAYAIELVHATDSVADRDAAARRGLEHYTVSADTADRLLDPPREGDAVPVAVPGVTPERFADQRAALAWFAAEHPALLGTLRRSRDDTRTTRLAWSLDRYFGYHGHWDDLVEVITAALQAALRSGALTGQAAAHRTLGCTYIRLGRFPEAGRHLDEALRLHRELQNTAGQAQTHRNLAWLLDRQGRHREALGQAERAAELYRACDEPAGLARALNAVGWFTGLLGDPGTALEHCREALDLQQRLGDRSGQAETWDSLGWAHLRLGRPDEAVQCYRTAIALYQEFDDLFNEADSTAALGDAHQAAGDATAARLAWQRAADLFDAIHHPDAGRVRARARQHQEALHE